MNAYEIYKEIRDGIGEVKAAHWTDRSLLRKMNQAQKVLWQDLAKSPGDWFLTSTDLTPASSVVTFPSDCARAVYMEDKSSGTEIPLNISVRERRLSRGQGTDPYEGAVGGYFTQVGIEINEDSYTDQVTLWYLKRIQDMHFGTAGASSAASALHFDAAKSPKYEDDYYNSLLVEVWDSDSVPTIQTTITDYAASTNIAVVTGTPASGDFYGTIPSIPEEGHYLIALDVIRRCLTKPASDFDPKSVQGAFALWKEQRNEWLEWIAMRGSKRSYIAIEEL